MYPYKLWLQRPFTIQNSVSQKSQNRLKVTKSFIFLSKRVITKHRHPHRYTEKKNRCSTVPAGWHLDLNRCTLTIRRSPQTDRLEIQRMCQSSYIALSCKISLLSRQRTTKMLIRLRGSAGWSAPLLFTYAKITGFLMMWPINSLWKKRKYKKRFL